MNSKIRIPFIVAVISIAQIAQIAQAKCQETDPRNAANKRHGKQINCHGGGGWEETTYANGVEEGAKKRFDGSGRLQELKTFKDGKPNGHGTYTWHTGSQYEGEFLDGLKHGKGSWKKNKDENI